MEPEDLPISVRSPAWRTTWSACRTFSYSKSRVFHRKAGLWARSPPRASDRSSPKSSRLLGSFCRQTCLNKRPSSGTEDTKHDADTDISPTADRNVRCACLFAKAVCHGKGGRGSVSKHRGPSVTNWKPNYNLKGRCSALHSP